MLDIATITADDKPRWIVQLGRYQEVAGYLKVFAAGGKEWSQRARDISKKVLMSPTLVDINLYVVSVGDLGFARPTRYDEICRRAIERGYALCPAEIGLAMREQCPDPPKGEYCIIAMEAIVDSIGGLGIFDISLGDDDQWLDAQNGNPDNEWNPNLVFIFTCRVDPGSSVL